MAAPRKEDRHRPFQTMAFQLEVPDFWAEDRMMRGVPKGDTWRGAEETAAATAVRMVEGRLLVWVAYQILCASCFGTVTDLLEDTGMV